jgi:hypothetical protein
VRRELTLLIVALGVACNRDSGAGVRCEKVCEFERNAIDTLAKDIDRADLAATELEGLTVASDAQIKPVGDRASELCSDIRSSVSHARALAWSLDNEPEKSPTMVLGNLPGKLEQLEKAATCAGRSPAQIKSEIAGPVHELKKMAPKYDAACTSKCAPKA